ncbi:MAG: ATP synthase F1 subunit epsilon [Candidatus Kapabacteria bacterium]|nr:ATP synthase F1 subunit epsilon [Candidatus Kapabacteria bacterium]
MAQLLTIDIVTPQSVAFRGAAQAVTLPGAQSPFQVLINHAPIISALEIGAIKVIDDNGHELYFATDGGFAEVKNNVVSIVVETAEPAADIDATQAQRDFERANERLETLTDWSERALEKANAHRAQNRLKVAEMASS